MKRFHSSLRNSISQFLFVASDVADTGTVTAAKLTVAK